MAYVERDVGNKVKGVYSRPQPGIAEEFLADDDAEIVAFRQVKPTIKPPAPPVPVGNSVPALRDEVAEIREALIDAGIWEEALPE